jgi:N-acetyl-gamma-glutamyl-phosphate reductase
VGSNRCLLSVFLDEHTGTAVVLAAIDNLMKGAAGNAVQCANLALGFDESAGLPVSGWMP